jgi:hypothetical protein
MNDKGRQNYVVCNVMFGGQGPATVDVVATVQAEDPATASCVLGTFVQDDEVDDETSNGNDFVLFYWIEAPPKDSADKDKLLARYKVFSGLADQSKSAYLSVTNGNRRYFARSASGDYFQGGCFHWEHDVYFLAQWREQDGIKGNIVSLPVPLAPRKFYEIAIDPWALLLPPNVYVRLVEKLHPHLPKVAEIRKALMGTSDKERTEILARARTAGSLARVIEEALAVQE